MPQPISLIEEQQRLKRDGKVRMGELVEHPTKKNPDGSAKTYPKALTKWRLTSANKTALEAAANMYGGEVTPWEGEPGQFELYTESEEIFIKIWKPIPTPCYEFYSQGGRLRRCMGEGSMCEVAEKQGEEMVVVEKPCFCEGLPDRDKCKLSMRFEFQLVGTPSLGTWTLETGSIYAALELPPLVNLLLDAKPKGGVLCKLAIEPREEKKPGKPQRNYVVPVLRVESGMASSLAASGGQDVAALIIQESAPMLPAGTQEALPAQSEHPAVPTNVNHETGEILAKPPSEFQKEYHQEEPHALDKIIHDYALAGEAADWLREQNPDMLDAIDLFEKLKAMGKSPQGTLQAKSVQSSDWATLTTLIEDKYTEKVANAEGAGQEPLI